MIDRDFVNADIAPRTIEEKADRRLEALWLAEGMWQNRDNAWDLRTRQAWARELHAFALFSIPQISKITRVNEVWLYKHLKKNALGGRFNPAHLRQLVAIRRSVLARRPMPYRLLASMPAEGTSLGAVASLVGVNRGNTYYLTRKAIEADAEND